MFSIACYLLLMKLIFILSVIGTLTAAVILAYSLSADFVNPHSAHTKEDKGHAGGIEDSDEILRIAEAKNLSRLTLDNNVIDAAHNCESCNQIHYTPGPQRKAGIWYINDKLDLIPFQRVVFFARGENGGEVVSFLALGNSSDDASSPSDEIPYQNFAYVTKNVTLGTEWKRYEIGLYGRNSDLVKYPFGFVITGHESGVDEIFYLKGVKFDLNPAQNPLPLYWPLS